MNVYFVEMPEDTAKREELNNLLNGLEAFYDMQTINVIGIKTADESLHGLLNSIAISAVCDEMPMDKREPKKKKVISKREKTGEPIECPICGKQFVPPTYKSKFCSKKCYMKDYNRDRYVSRSKGKKGGNGGYVFKEKINLVGLKGSRVG